jgi:flagellar motor switch protein FliN
MVVLITLETKVNEVEGMINFCIPYLTIEPIIGRLSNSSWYGRGNIVTLSENCTLVSREDIPVKLTAETLRRDYPLGEINDWKEGTVISPLCSLTPNHCYIRLGDRRVWYCKMMEDEKNYSKKLVIIGQAKMPFGTEDSRMETNKVNPIVTDALMMARMLITVELGATSKTVKEVFDIGERTVLELDKLAGEPLDVKANGVLIAKGEAVVVDENFGVRITEIVGTLDPCEQQETATAESQEQG